jgi:Fe-S-cluster containining protein
VVKTSDINPVCSKCISTGKVTCCSCQPWIPLTIEDIRRISRALGCDFKEFCVAEERIREDAVYFDDWRLRNLTVINGSFYMLCMRKINNCCIFLRKGDCNGCALGSERATICKLYPLWIDFKDKVVYEADDFCFFIKDKVPIREALKMLGDTEESIRNYHLCIKQDFIENNALHRKMLITLLDY